MDERAVAPSGTLWAVARAFGSRDAATAHTVEEAEDQQVDEQIRRRLTNKEIRDAMRPSFR